MGKITLKVVTLQQLTTKKKSSYNYFLTLNYCLVVNHF